MLGIDYLVLDQAILIKNNSLHRTEAGVIALVAPELIMT
jgi:hypothetical protein